MIKLTKTAKKAPKKVKKERIEEEMTKAGKYYKIYSGKKFIEMISEHEFNLREAKE